ncbi:hypothetical protein HPB51_011559 [Rhipicephalus microplus]|uniref:Uncharacterized protein n=1 Tax=Rhipicephalus microplus TaxID=6941 RepID=A0A9J6E0F2_RHIMP|nr:hypothetical protein HPB51_011559 [Rhipicephalus microplus]
MAASNGRGVASPAAVASNASETGMQPAKKPRRCFSAHEDLCLLREVAAAKPFGDDIKSGTEEQYSEKEEILQDLWDFCESVKYEPRIAPRGATCAARRRRLGAEPPVNTDELPGVTLSDDGTGDGALALVLNRGKRTSSRNSAPHQNQHSSSGLPQLSYSGANLQVCSTPSQARVKFPYMCTEKNLHSKKGIRGLQSVGLQLLAKREKNELDLRSRELEIEKMKVRHEERRLALDERRLALDEEKHRFEVERWRGERESLLDEIKKMLDEQTTKLAQHHNT